MKKLALLFFVWTFPVFAQSNDLPICQGDGVRTIPIDASVNSTVIQNIYLNNYKNYLRGNRYELCFTYTNPDSSKRFTLLIGPSLYVPPTADKQVTISGLDLRRQGDSNKSLPLFLSDGAEVTLHNDKFKCADGSKPSSIGIKLLGDAHQVINSEIQNCGVGIQIGDQTTPGNNNHLAENSIHDNGTGVLISNGNGNYAEHNSIYLNNANGDTTYAQEEGIKLNDGANGRITPPISLNTQGTAAKTDDSILSYPAGVTSLPADNQPPVLATFQIQTPYPTGTIEIDLVRPELYAAGILIGNAHPDPNQGREYFTDANCTAGATSYSCIIPMTSSKKGQKAVLLFHHPTFGTTTYSLRVILNGPGTIPLGGAEPGPVLIGSEATGGSVTNVGGEKSSGLATGLGGSQGATCSLSKNGQASENAYLILLPTLFVLIAIRLNYFWSKKPSIMVPLKTKGGQL